MSAQECLSVPQFFHGTRHSFKRGDLVEPGHEPNYDADAETAENSKGYVFSHENMEVAGSYGIYAKGEGNPQVFEVEPTGEMEKDTHMDMGGGGAWKTKSPMRVVSD